LRYYILSLAILFSLSGFSYRYICNSLDAMGNDMNDTCGKCNSANAPKWHPQVLSMRVNSDVVHKNLTKASWETLVSDAIESWKTITNLQLTIVKDTNTPLREFGQNPYNHVIFWIDQVDEWREFIGAGENGTLGVTSAPYECQGYARPSRQILDADLALNATSDIPWATKCTGSDICYEIISTLTHEVGHMLGLGHPCTDCTWSVMTAKGGANIPKPLSDDHNGLSSLYPQIEYAQNP